MDFRIQSTFNEADEPESQPLGRTSIVKFTEGFRVTEARINLSSDSDVNEMIAVAIGQSIVRLPDVLLCECSERERNNNECFFLLYVQ